MLQSLVNYVNVCTGQSVKAKRAMMKQRCSHVTRGIQGSANMASTSGMQCSLTEDELVEVLENLSSDLSKLSDSDSDNDNYLPENSDSDSDENNRVDPLEPAPKKLRSDAPLQWSSGNFTPNVHDFNRGNSGIRVDLNEHSTVFDFFKIFFPGSHNATYCR